MSLCLVGQALGISEGFFVYFVISRLPTFKKVSLQYRLAVTTQTFENLSMSTSPHSLLLSMGLIASVFDGAGQLFLVPDPSSLEDWNI